MSGGLVLQTLGYVAQTKRVIKPSNHYNSLFGAPSGVVKNIKVNPSVGEILAHMQMLVNSTLPQTAKFAAYLKQNNTSIENLLKALFTFMYQHIDYKEDAKGFEQLREPARLFLDKIGDCDCYSVFIKSVLQNLGIKSHFKVVKFNGNENFSHVYVVVPKFPNAKMSNKNDYWVIDPVLDTFNQEAKGITGAEITSLSGVGSLSGVTPIAPTNTVNPIDQLFADSSIGAVTSVKTSGGSTIKRFDDVNTDNPNNNSTNKQKSPILYGEGLNPFEQAISLTFKGTRLENVVNTQLAPRNKGLNGIGDIDFTDPLDPKNLDTLMGFPEVKDYTDKATKLVTGMSLAETQSAIKKLNLAYQYIKQNTQDQFSSNTANKSNSFADFNKSGAFRNFIAPSIAVVGVTVLTCITGSAALSGLVATGGMLASLPGAGFLISAGLACAASVVCAVVVLFVLAVAVLCYIFPESAGEAASNFVNWIGDTVNGRTANKHKFDNLEGFRAEVDVNVYGDLIRGWRKAATGSESGNDFLQNPTDYLPILLSIFQNAPIAPNGNLIVNPNKLAVHEQFISAIVQAYGTEFWKGSAWMKIRAFMCTPLMASIIYQEEWTSYKASLLSFFASKGINVNYDLIDREYLIESQNTLKLNLLIAKRDQIAHDNANNPNNNKINTTDPAKNGAIVWVGGQYGGSRSGFMTNQANLALKAGDQVFIQINNGPGAAYTGIRTIHSLGTDDGQYKENMFVIDMPMIQGAQNSTGVFQFQEPQGNNDSGGGGFAKIALIGAGIKILSAIL